MALRDVKKFSYGTQESQEQSVEEEYSQRWQFWKKRRYVVGILAFFGFFNVYALRVNLSIAIVAMTEKREVLLENGTAIYESDFDWDRQTQGYILSSFFYGYITTQLFGGWLSTKIGGKRIFGAGIGVTAALTLITPWLVSQSVALLLLIRVIEGIFEGVTYPCIHAIWAKWAPPLERTRLVTLAFSGSYFGTVVAMPVCALLAKSLGWQSIFYFFGVLGLLWLAIWMTVVAESPSEDKWITKAELRYIKNSLGHNNSDNQKIEYPLLKILTSMPVWAIVVAHFSENWGFYTLLTQLPKFMNDILDFDLKKTGFMSALPYLAMSIILQFAGHIADWLLGRNILTTTQVRKLFNCGAFLAQTVFMLAASYWLSPIGTTLCLTLAVGLGGFAWSGFSVNYLEVAPHHASFLMGFGNTIGTLPGILSPTITGYIVSTPNAGEWQIVFYMASAIYLFGAVFYGIFASSETEQWAIDSVKSTDSPHQMEENVNKSTATGHENKSFQPDS